jgi:hypothetical protein
VAARVSRGSIYCLSVSARVALVCTLPRTVSSPCGEQLCNIWGATKNRLTDIKSYSEAEGYGFLGYNCSVVQREPDVSDEYVAFIFRTEE